MGLRLSHRTLTLDLGAGPSSNTGPQLQSPTWDNVSDTGPQLPARMWDHRSIMGAQTQVWMQDPSSHTVPHLWVRIRDHAWGTGPHLPAQSQTKPLNPAHPQTLPRTCIGAMSAWRGLNSNSPSHGPASPIKVSWVPAEPEEPSPPGEAAPWLEPAAAAEFFG